MNRVQTDEVMKEGSPTSAQPAEGRSVLRSIERIEAVQRRREQDQRRAVRRSVRIDAAITPLLDSAHSLDPIRISIRDVSMTGMGFITSVPIPPGTLWRMSLLVEHYTLGQQALTVRHCRQVAPGVCVVGAQFCIDPSIVAIMGMKLDELAVRQMPDDLYDTEFVSPDNL